MEKGQGAGMPESNAPSVCNLVSQEDISDLLWKLYNVGEGGPWQGDSGQAF